VRPVLALRSGVKCRYSLTPSLFLAVLSTGSKDALKRVLLGIMVEMNATDDSELDFESCLLPKCRGR
jgi:hypothetical protein